MLQTTLLSACCCGWLDNLTGVPSIACFSQFFPICVVEYRYDSNGLAIELCRVVKDLFNADAMMFFVDECREKLLCTVRNLAVPTEDIFRSVSVNVSGMY